MSRPIIKCTIIICLAQNWLPIHTKEKQAIKFHGLQKKLKSKILIYIYTFNLLVNEVHNNLLAFYIKCFSFLLTILCISYYNNFCFIFC